MLRVLKILEMAWLLIALFSMFMGAYQFNTYGWDTAQWFFGGTVVAGIFYAFRRKQRKKFEESENNNSDK